MRKKFSSTFCLFKILHKTQSIGLTSEQKKLKLDKIKIQLGKLNNPASHEKQGKNGKEKNI